MGLDELPGVPRRTRPSALRDRRRFAGRTRPAPGVRDGRSWRRQRAGDRRRHRPHGVARRGRPARRRARVLDEPHPVAPLEGRRTGAGHHRRPARTARHRRGDPPRRPRRVPVRTRARDRTGGRVAVDARVGRSDGPAGQRQPEPARHRPRGVARRAPAARRGTCRRPSDPCPGGRPHDRHPVLPARQRAPVAVPPGVRRGGPPADGRAPRRARRPRAPPPHRPRRARRRWTVREGRAGQPRPDLAGGRRRHRLRADGRRLDRSRRRPHGRAADAAGARSAHFPRRQRQRPTPRSSTTRTATCR